MRVMLIGLRLLQFVRQLCKVVQMLPVGILGLFGIVQKLLGNIEYIDK